MRIGVFGANLEDVPEDVKEKARQIGREIAKRNHTIVTGACRGLPHLAVMAARELGGEAIGFSPATDMKSHREAFRFPTSGFSRLVFIPREYEHRDKKGICYKYRNVSSVASADAAVIINGRSGTLNEFLVAFDAGKRIGILKGSGGIADGLIDSVLDAAKKDTGSEIIFDSDPASLIEKITKL
jgi:predicted Rossmann-fold nucleotide-binding protein